MGRWGGGVRMKAESPQSILSTKSTQSTQTAQNTEGLANALTH